MMKEKELSKEQQAASVAEFNLVKGLIIAVVSGILSSFFNFGIEAGKPMAVVANEENMKILSDQIAAQKALEAQIKAEAVEVKNKMQDQAITLRAKSGPDGKLYGAVTSKDIAEAVHQSVGIEIDKRKIQTDAIKTTGTYSVKIKLHPEVDTTISVTVENE